MALSCPRICATGLARVYVTMGAGASHREVCVLGQTWSSAPPNVDLMKSLRSAGYSPGAAACDIVDNSITAKATRIWLAHEIAQDQTESFLAIADNGSGMTEPMLSAAMVAGSRDSSKSLNPGELGRFGLGLKVASLSQGRKLTVWSKREGKSALRQWDLSDIGSGTEWKLHHRPTRDAEGQIVERLIAKTGLDKLDSGTIVVWSDLDIMLESASTFAENQGNAPTVMARKVEEIKTSLSRVFHRFISGSIRSEAAIEMVQLRSDGTLWPLKAWDPFLQQPQNQSSFTSVKPMTILAKGERGEVLVQPYVLPHRDHLTGQQWKDLGADEGMVTLQGFYVYREERLISYGGWLGLDYVPDVHYKLARIALDLSNASDAAWNVNFLKSSVDIPESIRERLKIIAQETRAEAANVLSPHRKIARRPGQAKPPTLPIWTSVETVRDDRRFRSFRLNRKHPSLRDLVSESPLANAVLKMIETSIPYQQIQLLSGGHLTPELVNISDNSDAANLLRDEVVRREAKGQAPCDFFREILDDGLEPYALADFEVALGALMDEYECGANK